MSGRIEVMLGLIVVAAFFAAGVLVILSAGT